MEKEKRNDTHTQEERKRKDATKTSKGSKPEMQDTIGSPTAKRHNQNGSTTDKDSLYIVNTVLLHISFVGQNKAHGSAPDDSQPGFRGFRDS